MKNLFNLDNPFMQFLTKVGDMILVNAMFLICSVPIVTMGAALTAMHKVTQRIVEDTDRGVFRSFFEAFRQNFVQATICWVVMLLFLAGMGGNILLVMTFLAGNSAKIAYWIIGVVVCVILAVGAYLFPLIARYENTLRAQVMNAAILLVVKLPKTVVLVLLNALPFIILSLSLETFFSTFVYWLFIGFGFASYLTGYLLMPVFKEMEHPGGPEVKLMK